MRPGKTVIDGENMKTRITRYTSLLGLLYSLTFLPITAWAQAGATEGSLLDEVIVTA